MIVSGLKRLPTRIFPTRPGKMSRAAINDAGDTPRTREVIALHLGGGDTTVVFDLMRRALMA
ncbi:MAG TPA: hypothetical protein VFT47_20660 [Vicinamibacterales bacterium]|nr:hypothetical protein [Vicinamibacterales bacterium]